MNAGDQRSVKKARQREKAIRDEELKDLGDVLKTVQGRRFVWRVLTHAGCFRQSFVQGEPESTVFNEGRRSLGLMLTADVHQLDPSLYLRMANEARERDTHAERIDENTAPLTEETEDA